LEGDITLKIIEDGKPKDIENQGRGNISLGLRKFLIRHADQPTPSD